MCDNSMGVYVNSNILEPQKAPRVLIPKRLIGAMVVPFSAQGILKILPYTVTQTGHCNTEMQCPS